MKEFLGLVLVLQFGAVVDADSFQIAGGADQAIDATTPDYVAGGRRDPFLSVWAVKSDGTPRGHGVAGLEIGTLDLLGIVFSDQGQDRYAIVSGADDVGYFLQEGDVLHDGRVATIERDRVRLLKKVDDPLNPNPFEPRQLKLDPEVR